MLSSIMVLLLPTLSHHELCAGLVIRLEAAEKALAKERSARQTADRNLQATQDSASALNQELSSKVLEYLPDRVREVEDRMKRIANRVYKVGRRPDEADSRSGIQSR
jgi:hypothetical protein